MRVIINSDILHTDRPLSTGLPLHLQEFFRHAGASGARIVIPRVVALEDERHQASLVGGLNDRVAAAAELLRAHGIPVPAFEPSAIVKQVSIVDAVRAVGAQAEIENATLEDYRDAEERAARHAPPADQGTRSDEMRDLVIWAMALRLARAHGAALLISRDHVHSGPAGASEAASAGLIRAKNHDEAAEVLGQETPAGRLAREVLAVVWPTLRSAGLPLPAEVAVQRLSALQFSADASGHARGRLGVVVKCDNGTFAGSFVVQQSGENSVSILASQMSLNGAVWNHGTLDLSVQGTLPVITTPIEERLVALRGTIRTGL